MADTICSKFIEVTSKSDDSTAVLFPLKGNWLKVSWPGYRELVELTAHGLQQIGVRPGDRVAILSNTRLEWAVCDLAILGLSAICVPIYPNSTFEEIEFILNDCEARVVICENDVMARHIFDVRSKQPKLQNSLRRIVCMGELNSSLSDAQKEVLTSIAHLQKIAEDKVKLDPKFFANLCRQVKLEDTATILYTSGTTGRPKGVVLTHTQIMSEVGDAFPLLGVTRNDRTLTFLPFAHVLGRIEIWGHILIGYTMAYAESIDRLRHNLESVRPTLMIAVPRVFEKIHAGIISQSEISPIKRHIFNWSISVGRQMSQFKFNKKPVPVHIAAQYQVAKKLVFNQIQQKMGGQLRFAVCGGAPLNPEIAEFFHAAGLLILEGYGLTETTAAIAVNTPFDYRFGTVGKPVGDVRFKIAEDGEVLVSSKKVMKEYLNDPQATQMSLQDGWFRTGDIGEISEAGYLTITDRKKDLIKTAGGKYVAPQKLEGILKLNPYISHAHIHGDQKKYIVALVTLNPDALRRFAEENNLSYIDDAALTQSSTVKELVRKAVAEANSQLASFETIKNFAILPSDFTIESGELTPSLKIKRKVVDTRYRDQIENLYA